MGFHKIREISEDRAYPYFLGGTGGRDLYRLLFL